MSAALARLVFALVASLAQATTLAEYSDPLGRFRFSYPTTLGRATPGQTDTFSDRVAAVHFSRGRNKGGDASLTQGFPTLDLEAAGGLYDPMSSQFLPGQLRLTILQSLPKLTPANVCDELAKAEHLNTTAPQFAAVSMAQRSSLSAMDRRHNVGPTVLSCTVLGDTVLFDKEAGSQTDLARQHVYGAVRFLDGPYSTFQVVRAGAPPEPGELEELAAIVISFTRP